MRHANSVCSGCKQAARAACRACKRLAHSMHCCQTHVSSGYTYFNISLTHCAADTACRLLLKGVRAGRARRPPRQQAAPGHADHVIRSYSHTSTCSTDAVLARDLHRPRYPTSPTVITGRADRAMPFTRALQTVAESQAG